MAEKSEEEYWCSLSLSIAYDPINIAPTPFLYDRNVLETLVEKYPRNATIPQTREPLHVENITPNAPMRAEMRAYFAETLCGGELNEHSGWEVIPDYPRPLSAPFMELMLRNVRNYFSAASIVDVDDDHQAERLNSVTHEAWSIAWKQLNYLRLNLQLEPPNRDVFRSIEKSILCLGEIIGLSFHPHVKSEDSELFHREALRLLNEIHLTRDEACQILCLSPCFADFLLRIYGLEDEALQHIILGIFSMISGQPQFKPRHLPPILAYIRQANGDALSCVDLKNTALILKAFYQSIPHSLMIVMMNSAMPALVQIVSYLVSSIRGGDRMGNVNDASEALRVSLFLTNELCTLDEIGRASAIYSGLLAHIREMVAIMVVPLANRSTYWINLTSEHWELAMTIANTLYKHGGNVDSTRPQDSRLFREFHDCDAIAHHSYARVRKLVESILDVFLKSRIVAL